jgi:hypothetical protein
MHWLKRDTKKEKEKEMTVADDTNNQKQLIHCPNCQASMTVDQLGAHVNANPEIKKEAIERELELWGDAYDKNYLIQNVVFCPNRGKVSHYYESVMIKPFLLPFFSVLFLWGPH